MKMLFRRGFVIESLLIYLLIHGFICMVVGKIIFLYIMHIHKIESTHLALCTQCIIQNQFSKDCAIAAFVEHAYEKIIFSTSTGAITWKCKDHFLIRKVYDKHVIGKSKTYFCADTKCFCPFVSGNNKKIKVVGFTVHLFNTKNCIKGVVVCKQEQS